MSSGIKGTNTQTQEKPRAAIPIIRIGTESGKPKSFDGPKSNKENAANANEI